MAFQTHHAPPQLVTRAECIWTIENPAPGIHRIYPDGCIDFLYSRENGFSRLEVISSMTRFLDTEVPADAQLAGIRFLPGGLAGFALPNATTDTATDLTAIHPKLAIALKRRLDDASSVDEMHTILAQLPSPATRPPVARALHYLHQHHGQVDLDWLASQANLGPRQFRRLCRSHTGLAPKQLARILRFQRALAAIRRASRGDLTNIALDCGYFDQSHFIHDITEWAGQPPSALLP